MKTLSRILPIALSVSIAGCGGGSGTATPPTGAYSMTGRVQKGPFGVGSQITVNALNSSLDSTGAVYNSQTTDALGDFSVGSIASAQVEIVAAGFYFDEISGQLSSSQISLRSITDLTTNTTPTVNILTTLQEQRIKTLVSQGDTLAAASAQSQSEVLALFGISASTVDSLSTSDSMRIDGSTDEDAVLLAVSAVVAQMATDAAKANGTTQAAELSNLINTIAAGISSTGTMTSSAFTTEKDAANTEISSASISGNLQAYYAKNSVTASLPAFIEWVDQSNSGILPQRLVAVSGLNLSNVTNAAPGQSTASNSVTVAGVASGVTVPVVVPAGVTIVKNGVPVVGQHATAQEGDTLDFEAAASGYGISETINISVGSSTAAWTISSPQLGGSVTGLSGSGLVLQVNGGGNVTVPAGSSTFSLPAQIAVGSAYNVTVVSQPASPLQSCAVSGGAGTVGAGTPAITIDCAGVELVYITNRDTSSISEFELNATTGALSAIGSIATSATAFGISATHDGKFVYASSTTTGAAAGNIDEFAVSPGSGSLSLINTVSSVGFFPGRLTVDPGSNYVYVPNENSPGISEFAIDHTSGALTSIGTMPASTSALTITVGPTSQFAYVPDGSDIDVFGITAGSGVLTSVATVPADSGVANGVVTPNGEFAYFASNSSVTLYTVDPTSGTLTQVSSLSAGLEMPFGLAVDPAGQYLYIASMINNTISEFAIDSGTGALSSIGSVVLGSNTESTPQSLAFDPSGAFLLATDAAANTVSTYRLDQSTGLLSLVGSAPTGSLPTSMTVVSAP